MCTTDPMISLGFTREMFPPGVHICQIFNSDAERESALLSFLESGLVSGEKTACFTEKTSQDVVAKHLRDKGLDWSEIREKGAFTLGRTSEVYLHNQQFEPARMLELLAKFHDESVRKGFTACRVIGEMTPEVEGAPGGSRLLEYESRVSQLLRTHPVSAVCQYDASSFDGATLMDVLRVHPLMIVKGAVVRNPFYIPPEEFLANLESDA